MLGTITQQLAGLSDRGDADAIRQILEPIGDRLSTQTLSSAGLVIKAGTSALVKAGSITYISVKGKLVKLAANTDMAALAGTVTNAKFNVYCFYVDRAGVLTSAMGVEGAAIGSVVFPSLPEGKALIGFAIINPTGTGNFVGGTTPLDDATVVPNAAYVNITGAFDPTILL